MPLLNGKTHKGVIHSGGDRMKFFVTVNVDEDGRPCQMFMHMDASGSTLDGFADAWAIAMTHALRAKADKWQELCEKLSWGKFEPMGFTDNPDMRNVGSVVDYVCRWMLAEFGEGAEGDGE